MSSHSDYSFEAANYVVGERGGREEGRGRGGRSIDFPNRETREKSVFPCITFFSTSTTSTRGGGEEEAIVYFLIFLLFAFRRFKSARL